MTDTEPPSWTNWSERLSSDAELAHVRSEEDVAARLAAAAAAGTRVRAAGSSHSHMPLIPNEDVIVDTSALTGVVSHDEHTQRAWLMAGSPIATLGPQLHERGLALRNQGDIDRQAIAGAAATGTHGTGLELQNLSAGVVGARIVIPSGDVVECSETENHDVWAAARLNLGALGVVTRLEFQLREAYRLRETRTIRPFEEARDELADLPSRSRHYEFFWLPEHDIVVEKAIDETDDDPEYPIAAEGKRCGWNYEVLPSHRPWKHTEIEYSVPLNHGPDCMAEIRAMVQRDHPDMPWAVEYRTLAADDVWMSTAYERPTVTISLHYDVGQDETPMFSQAESIFREHDGRPHWGKVNYLDGPTLAELHPSWDDWWTVRDRLDPAGTMLNPYLLSIRP